MAAAQPQQAEVLGQSGPGRLDRAERLVATGAVAQDLRRCRLPAQCARQAQVQQRPPPRRGWICPTPASRRPSPGRVDRVLVTGQPGQRRVAGAATAADHDRVHRPAARTSTSTKPRTNVVSRSRPAVALSAAGLAARAGRADHGQGFSRTGALDFVGNTIDRSTGTIRARRCALTRMGVWHPACSPGSVVHRRGAQEAVLIDDQAVGAPTAGATTCWSWARTTRLQYRPIELGPVVMAARHQRQPAGR